MGVDFEEKDVCMMIDCFCQREDALGVPPNKLFDLFDDFCKNNGYLCISHLTLGRIYREHFNRKENVSAKGKNCIGYMFPLIDQHPKK